MPSRQDAEFWAEQLRMVGYVVKIEGQHDAIKDGNADLAAALSSMA